MERTGGTCTKYVFACSDLLTTFSESLYLFLGPISIGLSFAPRL